MHGLSKDLDLSFLNGRQVAQVAIGVHEIIFGFDEDVKTLLSGCRILIST
jgi:hypothetical protein